MTHKKIYIIEAVNQDDRLCRFCSTVGEYKIVYKVIRNITVYFLCLLLLSCSVETAHRNSTNYFVYISLRNDNAIVIYKMNPETGGLDSVHTEWINGGPASLSLDPKKRYLYIAQRSAKTISAYNIDHQTGFLTHLNTIPAVDNPVYISTDKSGSYLFSAYYSANKVAIYSLDCDGRLKSPAIQIFCTDKNPHAILTDASNRFVFIPNKSADKILQCFFNPETGRISPADPTAVSTAPGAGPRHFDFHRTKDIVYFVNETNSSVTAYHLKDTAGILLPFQTISTLPESFTGQNTCADIHLTPDDRFLYASNRGHESIAAFAVDSGSGELTTIGQYITVREPREFDIDPTGNFLYAAGEYSDSLASYRIHQETGELETLQLIYAGNRPSWVLAVDFSLGEKESL
jgi:6-phosphogluconolactonase